MKYEIGDTIKYGNSGYELEGVVVKARPPQPTYDIKGTIDGGVRIGLEEDRLALVKKKPVPCGHIKGRVEKRGTPEGYRWSEPTDYWVLNDFCPLCGEDIRHLHGK